MKKTIFAAAALCMLALTGVSANELPSNENPNLITSVPELSSFCKAVMQGDVETVKKLIELGEDVNQKSLGMAPVHFAARYNKAEVLQVLIDNGANLKQRCDKGYSVKKHAELSNATEVLALLETVM